MKPHETAEYWDEELKEEVSPLVEATAWQIAKDMGLQSWTQAIDLAKEVLKENSYEESIGNI